MDVDPPRAPREDREAPEFAPDVPWEGRELFQIGADVQGLRFCETDFVNIANPKPHETPRPWPVYQCRRGTEGLRDQVLFLFRTKAGPWVAVEHHKDVPDPVNAEGRAKFMTVRADLDDLLKYKRIQWSFLRDGDWSEPDVYCTKLRPPTGEHGDAAAGPAAKTSRI